MLEKREAVVLAKEQSSLERIQEKRDATLFAIGDALEIYKKAVGEPFAKSMGYGQANAILEEKPDVKVATPDSGNVKPAGNDIMEVNPRPELIKLCQEMDTKGLHKFISDNRKDLAALREEVPFALKRATDPGRLILWKTSTPWKCLCWMGRGNRAFWACAERVSC